MILVLVFRGPVEGTIKVEPWGDEAHLTVFRLTCEGKEMIHQAGWRPYQQPYVSTFVWNRAVKEGHVKVHRCGQIACRGGYSNEG